MAVAVWLYALSLYLLGLPDVLEQRARLPRQILEKLIRHRRRAGHDTPKRLTRRRFERAHRSAILARPLEPVRVCELRLTAVHHPPHRLADALLHVLA